MKLQKQYNNIYSFFKNTTEPFDKLEWDGYKLEVVYEDRIIEIYSFDDLRELKIKL